MKRIICNLVLLLLFSCNAGVEVEPQVENPPDENFTVPANPLGKNLFVSLNGDDSLSYEENDIDHPWASPQHGWYNARPGDIVYIRGGVYETDIINLADFGMNGTAEKPIVISAFNNESVTIRGNGSTGGSPMVYMEKEFHRVNNITFIGNNIRTAVILVGYDQSGRNFKIENSTVIVESTADNVDCTAPIHLYASLADFTEIRNCTLVGTNETAGIFIVRTQGFKIENNDISGALHGIFMKHSNALDSSAQSINHIQNNYIHGCQNSSIFGAFNYAVIHNNLIVGMPIILGVDGGLGDGYLGADYNTITHNTMVDSGIVLAYEYRTPDEDPNRGCLHNTIENNIISSQNRWHPYDKPSDAAGIPMDDYNYDVRSNFNLYPDIADLFYENRISYTLSEWQTKNSSDSNSLLGTAVFSGGANPERVDGFALAAASPGKGAASDGSDMGADVSLVGIQ